MPPKDITRTGPQTGTQLQQQNDEFTQYFGDYKKWASYKDLRKQGFNDNQVSRLYRNAVFKSQYGARLDFDRWAKSMSPEQRDNILIMQVTPKKDLGRIPGFPIEEPTTPIPFGPVDMQRVYSNAYQDRLAEEAIEGSTELTPVENDRQAAALYKKLEKEALELWPENSWENRRLNALEHGTFWERLAASIQGSPIAEAGPAANEIFLHDVRESEEMLNRNARAEYIKSRMKVPQNDNNFYNLSEAEFYRLLPALSDNYQRWGGTPYIPKEEENMHQLYLDNKKYLDAGLLYRAKANIDHYYNGVIGRHQPTWSSDDPAMRSKANVLLASTAGAFVENTLNEFAVPAGAVAGVAAPVIGKNYWQVQSILPNFTHSIGQKIMGEDAVAYGNGWTDQFFNSGVTFGAMASEVALAVITRKLTRGLKGTTKVGGLAKKYGDIANTLIAGVREGTMDAVELRNELLKNAEQIAVTLPENQRKEFLRNAAHEANTAYGRTLIEEAAIVDMGTIMGLGFLGAINAPKAGARFAMKWQNNLVPANKLAKWGVGAGHVFEQVGTRTLGELLEEYGQGLASGINKARATDNINNYAMALRYGLGSQYMNDAHIGVLQGLFGYTPQAWAEMDPENLTKQVLVSTLLFNGAHIPGTGKTRQRIEAESNNKLGKVLDYIHKYSPIQTGIGEIAANVREEMHGQENALTAGWNALLHDNDVINVLQTQAALADIGIQMADAINNKDITSYQKMSAAYYAAQAVMLANAINKGAKFGQEYLNILQNRANITSLSQEEQTQMLEAIEKEVPLYLQGLSPEDKLQAIESVAKRSLDLVEQAQSIFAKYSETGMDTNVDIRPLVFGELLNSLAPEIVKENWNQIQPAIDKLLEENPSFGKGEDTKSKAIDFILNNYFKQPSLAQRATITKAISEGKLVGITRTDAKEAFMEIVEQLSKELPNIEEIIKSDTKLLGWTSDVYNQWDSLFKRVRAGEGTLTRKQLAELENVPKLASERRIRKIQKEILKAKSVSELTNLYNSIRQDDEIIDVDKIFREIEDPSVQKKVAEMRKIHQAFNSISAAISSSSLPLELKENLLGQVEGLMNSQNSASALYDIANYSLSGVRPDEKDKMAGELSQILSSAKSTADNAQTVYTNPVDSKKDSQFGQATDLSSRDVDTAPAVNREPIKRFTPEEAAKLVNEINTLLAKNEFMTATPMINELQKRCPEGYQFMQGGTQVALKKIDTSTPISEVTVDESLEEEPEFVPEGEVVIDEELDSSLDAYPDEDVRSITKIAIVTFEPGGREYAYPVRDEDVQMGDTVEGKSNQGKIERFETPDEYAVKHSDGDYTLDKLAKFKRGTFIDRHTDKVEAAEPVPVKRVVTTHRSETQQSRLNANVTPARNEVSPQHIKDGSMTRLGDTNHTNIDSQLDENEAFRYVDEGMLNQNDELVFVVTEEEMPDGQKAPVIWEVTKSKTEDLPTDSKFLGYQVINVLDQTSMSGDRGELIARIREAYEKAGKPASFLYDSEPVKVKNIVKGFIPTRQTNPVDAQSQETIASTNLKQGLVKSNGRWGVMFKSSKTGKLMHVPVVLRQIKRDIDGNIKPSISHTGIDTIETIKHNPLTQDETREVMLVVPTPTGWQAAHSVYVLKRDIQDAVENYKEAINNGVLGERLIAKAMLRFTDPKATTAFSDFLRFNRGISERIVFDPNHNRLELGIRGNLDTTFVYASKRGETWVITEADARNILDDNEGKGFTTEEVLKRYLNALADSEDASISVQINMDAISKDNSIIDALIDDGFLWAPNSYPGRLTMENVGFEAPLSETAEAEPKIEDNVTTKTEPAITAPKPSNPVIEEPVTTTQKIKVPNSVDSNDVGAMVPRKKKSSSSEKKISITPTTPRTEQASTQEAPLMDELKVEAKKSYNELSAESKAHLEEKGISQEEWDKHPEIHENVLNC